MTDQPVLVLAYMSLLYYMGNSFTKKEAHEKTTEIFDYSFSFKGDVTGGAPKMGFYLNK